MTPEERIASNRRAINAYRESGSEPDCRTQTTQDLDPVNSEDKEDKEDKATDEAVELIVFGFIAIAVIVLAFIGMHTVFGWLFK